MGYFIVRFPWIEAFRASKGGENSYIQFMLEERGRFCHLCGFITGDSSNIFLSLLYCTCRYFKFETCNLWVKHMDPYSVPKSFFYCINSVLLQSSANCLWSFVCTNTVNLVCMIIFWSLLHTFQSNWWKFPCDSIIYWHLSHPAGCSRFQCTLRVGQGKAPADDENYNSLILHFI